MKAIISRTSSSRNNEPPCEEAKLKEFFTVEWINIKFINKEFLENGEDHREENGLMMRRIKRKIWVINIRTMNQLTLFMRKYGRIVIEPNKKSEGIDWEIEIYDDYRE